MKTCVQTTVEFRRIDLDVKFDGQSGVEARFFEFVAGRRFIGVDFCLIFG